MLDCNLTVPKTDDKQAIHSKADISIDGKLYDLDVLPKIGYGCIKLLGIVIALLHSEWLNIAAIKIMEI